MGDSIARLETRKDLVGLVLPVDGGEESLSAWIVAAANHHNLLWIREVKIQSTKPIP